MKHPSPEIIIELRVYKFKNAELIFGIFIECAYPDNKITDLFLKFTNNVLKEPAYYEAHPLINHGYPKMAMETTFNLVKKS